MGISPSGQFPLGGNVRKVSQGNGQKVSHPQPGFSRKCIAFLCSLVSSLALSPAVGAGEPVGNAKRFPRGVGGCRAGGGGGSLPYPGRSPAGGDGGAGGRGGRFPQGRRPWRRMLTVRRQGWLRGVCPGSAFRCALARAIRMASRGQDVSVMRQPVQQRRGQLFVAKHLHPLSER
jgi:hypothetical protein